MTQPLTQKPPAVARMLLQVPVGAEPVHDDAAGDFPLTDSPQVAKVHGAGGEVLKHLDPLPNDLKGDR